jgi:hypothetical protein
MMIVLYIELENMCVCVCVENSAAFSVLEEGRLQRRVYPPQILHLIMPPAVE